MKNTASELVNLYGYQGIIFDMDGTLVDSLSGHFQAWKSACDKFAIPFQQDLIHRLSGMPSVKVAVYLCELNEVEADPNEIAQFKFDEWKRLDSRPELIQETYKIFQHHHTKIPISVGTGAKRASAEIILSKVNILDRLDALVTATDVENGKPAGDTFLKAANLMGVEPSKCIVFEDTEIGAEAALNAGMDCYVFANGLFTFRSKDHK